MIDLTFKQIIHPQEAPMNNEILLLFSVVDDVCNYFEPT